MCDCEKRIDGILALLEKMAEAHVRHVAITEKLSDRVDILSELVGTAGSFGVSDIRPALETDTTPEGPKIGPLTHDGIEGMDDSIGLRNSKW